MDSKEPKPSTAASTSNISKSSISIDKKNHIRPHDIIKNTEQLIAKQVIMNSSIEKNLHSAFKDLIQQTYGDIEALHFTFRHTIIVFKDRLSAEKAILNKYFNFNKRCYIINRMYYVFEPKAVMKHNQKKIEPPVKNENPEIFNFNGSFDIQLQMMIKTVEMTLKKLSELNLLLSDIQNELVDDFPGCLVIPFGSIMTGMAFKQSDVDCFVLIHPEQMEELDAAYKDTLHSRLVNRTKKIFDKSKNFTNILAIPRASVPIVKLFHLQTQFNCDISFKNGFGVHNSKLISYLLSSNTRLKPLTIFIKYWARMYGLTTPGKFSNYAIILFIIFFLQQVTPKILGPICDLQKDNRFDIIINLWNCGFDYVTMLPKTENSSPVLVLLRDFFGFYKDFDFANNVICPFVGKAIPVTTFNSLESLLPSYKLYVEYVRANIVKHITSIKKSVYLQDPFEHNRNCTSSGCPKLLEEFTHHCKLSHETIEKAMSTNNYVGIIKNLLSQKPPMSKKKNKSDNKKYMYLNFPKLKNATFDRALLISNMKTLFTSIFTDMFRCTWTLKTDKSITKNDKEAHILEFDCKFSHSVWNNRKEHYKQVVFSDPLAREIEVTRIISMNETANPPVLFDCKITVNIRHDALNIFLEKKRSEDTSHFPVFVNFFESKIRKIMTHFLLKQKFIIS